MKKIYILSIALLSTLLSFSQVEFSEKSTKLNSEFKKDFNYRPFKSSNNNRAVLENNIINFGYALTVLTDSTPLNGYVYLFPDTMPRQEYAGVDYSFYRFTDRYHAAGDVLDLSSLIFNSLVADAFDENKAYEVDSVYIGYYYNRNITDVTDTVRIYVSVEDGMDFVKGDNENPFPIVAYDEEENAPKSYVKVIDVLMNQSDTAWYGNDYMGVELDIDLEPNQLMSLVINYIPGYEYSDTSSYFYDCNPMILSCTKELKSTKSHMMSLGLEETLRFNQGLLCDFYQRYQVNIGDGAVWNERYANTYANEYWTKRDGENIYTRYNHLDTWYTVSTKLNEDGVPVGVDDDIDFKTQVYPNPATNEVIVELAQIEGPIEIYNSLGVLVDIVEQPTLKNRIDISHLKLGVYWLKIGDVVHSIVKE